MSIELMLIALSGCFLAHAFGLYASRKGAMGTHATAFWVGLIGVFSVVGSLGALVVLLPQFLFASSSSPAGMAFHAGFLVAGVCAIASIWLAASILRLSPKASAS